MLYVNNVSTNINTDPLYPLIQTCSTFPVEIYINPSTANWLCLGLEDEKPDHIVMMTISKKDTITSVVANPTKKQMNAFIKANGKASSVMPRDHAHKSSPSNQPEKMAASTKPTGNSKSKERSEGGQSPSKRKRNVEKEPIKIANKNKRSSIPGKKIDDNETPEISDKEHTVNETTSKKKKKKEKDPNAPKRPLTTYMLYCKDMRQEIVKENPDKSVPEIGKILGQKYHKLSKSEKDSYVITAQRLKEQYDEDKVEYAKKQKNEIQNASLKTCEGAPAKEAVDPEAYPAKNKTGKRKGSIQDSKEHLSKKKKQENKEASSDTGAGVAAKNAVTSEADTNAALKKSVRKKRATRVDKEKEKTSKADTDAAPRKSFKKKAAGADKEKEKTPKAEGAAAKEAVEPEANTDTTPRKSVRKKRATRADKEKKKTPKAKGSAVKEAADADADADTAPRKSVRKKRATRADKVKEKTPKAEGTAAKEDAEPEAGTDTAPRKSVRKKRAAGADKEKEKASKAEGATAREDVEPDADAASRKSVRKKRATRADKEKEKTSKAEGSAVKEDAEPEADIDATPKKIDKSKGINQKGGENIKKSASTKKRKKDPNAPKRPLTSYMLYCKDHRKGVLEENPGMKVPQVGSALGTMFKKLSEEEKETYVIKAKELKKQYDKDKEAYLKGKNIPI